jgi:trehalose 6-phosphate synthase
LPPPELFLRLPDRLEILHGLLGADVVGFQRPQSARNFLALTEHLLGIRASGKTVSINGRAVLVDTFPISVDVTAFESVARKDSVRRRAAQIRAELGGPQHLLLGLDRLDYTKGIPQRLDAYGSLLEQGRISSGTTAFIQVAPLSRERATHYANLRARVERLAGHLNASHGRVGNSAVHYIQHAPDLHEKVALYLAADVLVVSPLKDGMNLVAKEFVASRIDDCGALVLSEFAGVAAELHHAITINPYDMEGFKNAILTALTMTPDEQAERMSAMREHLRTHDIEAWHTTFLTVLNSP